jgi:hypothetical protein
LSSSTLSLTTVRKDISQLGCAVYVVEGGGEVRRGRLLFTPITTYYIPVGNCVIFRGWE